MAGNDFSFVRFDLELPHSKGEKFSFDSAESVQVWAERQEASFAEIASKGAGNIWLKHVEAFSRLKTSSQKFAAFIASFPSEEEIQHSEGTINQHVAEVNHGLQPFKDGSLITSFNPAFLIAKGALRDGDTTGADLILQLATSTGLSRQNIQVFNRHIEKILKSLLSVQAMGIRDERSLEKWDAELISLQNNFSDHNNKMIERIAESESVFYKFASKLRDQTREQSEAWSKLVSDSKQEWVEMKAVYDEKLALLAPTDYWNKRSESHKASTKIYAGVFGGSVAAAIVAFIWAGIPYLRSIQAVDGQSAIVSILPVVVPIFAAVWILRIIARQLSENMTLMQDARERVTMVMTFLALMRDDETGKSVVTDQDRILILHSLFRPSTVTATDDSPPISVLERLSGKKS